MKNNYILSFGLFLVMLCRSMGGWAQVTEIDLNSSDYTINSGGNYIVTNYTGQNTVVVKTKDDVILTIDNVKITSTDKDCINASDGGNVTLILKGTNELTASATNGGGGNDKVNANAIAISEGNFTIEGDGQLTAISKTPSGKENEAPGIGPNRHRNGGNIIINSGVIVAQGGGFGAGIGSTNGAICKDIIINGGVITAKGSCSIGAGQGGHCGDIKINGGTIYAPNGIGNGPGGNAKTFITEPGGHAFIYATLILDNQSIQSGTVFVNGTLTYQGELTVYQGGIEDFPKVTLEVGGGKTLVVDGGTLKANVTKTGNGKIYLANGGKIDPAIEGTLEAFKVFYYSNIEGDDDPKIFYTTGSELPTPPSRPYYSFINWNDGAGNKVEEITTNDKTIYAQWEKNTVKFNVEVPSNVTYKGTSYPALATVNKEKEVMPDIQTNKLKMSYSTEQNGPYTDEAPINAGTWFVKAEYEDENYEKQSKIESFKIQKATLTADMFSFTAPTNPTYNKNGKEAEVKVDSEGLLKGEVIGTIELHYYKDGKEVNGLPVNAGTYTVKISVGEDEWSNYNAVNEEDALTGDYWVFEIEKAKVPDQTEEWQTQSPYIAGEKIEFQAPAIQGLDEEVEYGNVTVSYDDGQQGTYPTEPGTYTVTATYTGSKNYQDTKVETTIVLVAADDINAMLPNTVEKENNGWHHLSSGGDYPIALTPPDKYVFVIEGTEEDKYEIAKDGVYEYSLKRNEVGLTATVTHTLYFDNTAPTIPTAPDEESLTTTSATFTLADETSGIASYTIWVDGEEVASYSASTSAAGTEAPPTGERILTYTYEGSPGTKHTISIGVADMAGNTAKVENVEFRLKNIPYIPSYYDLHFEPNDSVTFTASKTSVVEGSPFVFTAEAAEGYDLATLVVEYKRGRNGTWKTLEAESNGKFRIRSVYNDIYVRASIQPIGDPTAIDRVEDGANRVCAIGKRICITVATPVEVRVVTLGGRIVRTEKLSAGYNELSGLPSGMYIVMLSDGTRCKVMIR